MYKFHLINSNTKIINRLKFDLWGTILLTKKNKYRRKFNKLYDKKRKRFKYFPIRRFLFYRKFLKIKNNKLFFKNKKCKKKFFKFKKKRIDRLQRLKKLNYFFKNKIQLKNSLFYLLKKRFKNLKKFIFFKKKIKKIIFLNTKKFKKKFKSFRFLIIYKQNFFDFFKLNFKKNVKVRKFFRKRRKFKFTYFPTRKLLQFNLIYYRKKTKLLKKKFLKKYKILRKFKRRYNKLNDMRYLLKNKYNNNDFFALVRRYGSSVPRGYKKLIENQTARTTIYQRTTFKTVFNIKSIELFKKRKKLTKLGKAFRQKENLRRFLGNCSNRQLKAFFYFFKTKKNNFNITNFIQNFFINLESTLLFFLIRAKFFLMQLKYLKNFIIKHGILVNNKLINNPYYRIKIFDKINFPFNLFDFIKFNFLKNFSKYSKSLSYILISYSTLSLYYFKKPNLKKLDYGFKFNANLFRQFYYKNKFDFKKVKIV